LPLAYTRRLVAGFHDDPASILLWSHPGDAQTYITRDIVIANQTGSASAVHLWIQGPTAIVASLYREPALPAGTSVHVDLRQELHPGETLWGYSAEHPWSIAITGYVFAA
jgi:hypothetical protein